jgi:hypothetical protein
MQEGNTSSEAQQGMIPRAIDQIFEIVTSMREAGWTFDVHASHLEVSVSCDHWLVNKL